MDENSYHTVGQRGLSGTAMYVGINFQANTLPSSRLFLDETNVAEELHWRMFGDSRAHVRSSRTQRTDLAGYRSDK